MRYYSTNGKSPTASLGEAVTRGLAPDRGLYMPERVAALPGDLICSMERMGFREIALEVARALFLEDVPGDVLRGMVYDALNFDCPVVRVEDGIYSLELFHGPTLAFKDVGARFMARMLAHFGSRGGDATLNVLVATSGDTGSAVANGFLGVEGIHVHVLYPKGKVSPIQERQFTTLGCNTTALEIDGTFDDCQALVKRAFMDGELAGRVRLTSANSINVARFLPQAFYYFNAYARLKALGAADNLVVCVPSGNLGNLAAGLVARRMGLPVRRFIAANNSNDVFLDYLRTGRYSPRPSVETIANAMDVGDPSNFARVLDLFGHDHGRIASVVSGASYSDGEIRGAMRSCHDACGYVLDPHGACGYAALKDLLRAGETGVFLETAHPAKFGPTVEGAIGTAVPVPDRLASFLHGERRCVPLGRDYAAFREFLLSRAA